MIPIHATATSTPQQLRFVVSPGNLPPRGTVRQAPDTLGVWLDSGVIAEVVVRDADVLITLSSGNSWREFGDQIRDALGDALLEPAGWQVDPPTGSDDRLAEIVTDLLAGQIGALAESHGGSIELVSVTGNSVTVRMAGACHGCPASESTLSGKLQHELRRRVGDQVTVCNEASTSQSLGKKLLNLLIR